MHSFLQLTVVVLVCCQLLLFNSELCKGLPEWPQPANNAAIEWVAFPGHRWTISAPWGKITTGESALLSDIKLKPNSLYATDRDRAEAVAGNTKLWYFRSPRWLLQEKAVLGSNSWLQWYGTVLSSVSDAPSSQLKPVQSNSHVVVNCRSAVVNSVKSTVAGWSTDPHANTVHGLRLVHTNFARADGSSVSEFEFKQCLRLSTDLNILGNMLDRSFHTVELTAVWQSSGPGLQPSLAGVVPPHVSLSLPQRDGSHTHRLKYSRSFGGGEDEFCTAVPAPFKWIVDFGPMDPMCSGAWMCLSFSTTVPHLSPLTYYNVTDYYGEFVGTLDLGKYDDFNRDLSDCVYVSASIIARASSAQGRVSLVIRKDFPGSTQFMPTSASLELPSARCWTQEADVQQSSSNGQFEAYMPFVPASALIPPAALMVRAGPFSASTTQEASTAEFLIQGSEQVMSSCVLLGGRRGFPERHYISGALPLDPATVVSRAAQSAQVVSINIQVRIRFHNGTLWMPSSTGTDIHSRMRRVSLKLLSRFSDGGKRHLLSRGLTFLPEFSGAVSWPTPYARTLPIMIRIIGQRGMWAHIKLICSSDGHEIGEIHPDRSMFNSITPIFRSITLPPHAFDSCIQSGGVLNLYLPEDSGFAPIPSSLTRVVVEAFQPDDDAMTWGHLLWSSAPSSQPVAGNLHDQPSISSILKSISSLEEAWLLTSPAAAFPTIGQVPGVTAISQTVTSPSCSVAVAAANTAPRLESPPGYFSKHSFTISLWFRFASSGPSGTAPVFTMKSGSEATDDKVRISVTSSAVSVTYQIQQLSEPSNSDTISCSQSISADSWYHVAFSLENPRNKADLYFNGMRCATQTSTAAKSSRASFGSGALVLFGTASGSPLAFTGIAGVQYMEDLLIFGDALDQDDVRQLFGTGIVPRNAVPHLVAAFGFTDGTADTVSGSGGLDTTSFAFTSATYSTGVGCKHIAATRLGNSEGCQSIWII